MNEKLRQILNQSLITDGIVSTIALKELGLDTTDSHVSTFLSTNNITVIDLDNYEGKRIPKAVEQDLIKKAQDGDSVAMEKLIKQYRPLLMTFAARYVFMDSFEDVYSSATIYFIEAVNAYDGKQVFAGYAKKVLLSKIDLDARTYSPSGVHISDNTALINREIAKFTQEEKTENLDEEQLKELSTRLAKRIKSYAKGMSLETTKEHYKRWLTRKEFDSIDFDLAGDERDSATASAMISNANSIYADEIDEDERDAMCLAYCRQEVANTINESINKMPDFYKRVAMLTFGFNELNTTVSVAKTAEMLNANENDIYRAMRDIKNRVKKQLKDIGITEYKDAV